jgi:hypothetical protein
MAEMNVTSLNHNYPFVRLAPDRMIELKPITYQLLAESPDKIDNWIKRYPRIQHSWSTSAYN